MKKVIIGIHGLKNKPSENTLKRWWIESIKQGLLCVGEKKISFDFDFVYWADLNYQQVLDENILDPENPLYVKNPYQKIEQNCQDHKEIKFKKRILDHLEKQVDKLLLKESGIPSLEKIEDLTLRKMFIDLDTYYHGNCRNKVDSIAKDAIRNRMVEKLQKHKNKKIMIIAHSMGSIIAFDTFYHLAPDISIDSFLTMGSPLGVPLIMRKILQEMNLPIHPKARIPTPESIQQFWFNFSDLNDKICVNYNLADDYCKNLHKVSPIDLLVNNKYQYKGENNPHKIYGYLQTPEVAKVILNFLESDQNIWTSWKATLNKIFHIE